MLLYRIDEAAPFELLQRPPVSDLTTPEAMIPGLADAVPFRD